MFETRNHHRFFGVCSCWPLATPAATPSLEQKAAQERYDADRQLCSEETTAAARLQCRRDAKAEYDKALAAAKAPRPAPAVPAVPAATSTAPASSRPWCPRQRTRLRRLRPGGSSFRYPESG